MHALRLVGLVALMGARALADLVPDLFAIVASDAEREIAERIEPLLPPGLRRNREGLSETGTIAGLRFLISAQEEFRAAAFVDEDGDGRGEFGGLAELMGSASARGRLTARPILRSRTIDGGRLRRLGYYYHLYLPRRGGGLVAERPEGGFARGEVDIDRAETAWFVYAWPVEEADAGQRTFFASSAGEILATGWSDELTPGGYAADHEPAPHATEGPDWSVATTGTGRDGRCWRMTG